MWAYEHRGWEPLDWEIQLGARVSKGSVRSRFEAVQDLLRHDYKNRTMLDQIDRCGDVHPCQQKYCHKCYGRPLDPEKWRVDQRKVIAEDVLNQVYYNDWVGIGPFRHIQKVKKFLEPFYGLPINEIAPFTTKFCYLQGGEDFVAVKDWYSKRMRDIGQEFRRIVDPDVKFSYRFEWSFTTAKDAVWDMPLRAPGVADVKTMNPDQVVAFLHCHGISHFPGFTYRQAGQFFRMVFDGPSQVHVSTPRVDQVASACGSWPSMIELEKAVSSKPVTKLSDHPDDAAWPHDTNNTQSSYDLSKDHIWDAMVDELFGDEAEDAGWREDEDGQSGIAGFVNYLHKEHLPKAESRYQKLADAKHNQSSSTYEADTPCLSKVLSPEQMVVAVHADAELKRAFHKKRLTQSFGTQKKVRSNNNKTATSTNKVKQSSNSTAVEHHQLGKTSEQVGSFNADSNLKSKAAVHGHVDHPENVHRYSNQSQTNTLKNKKAPTYKEDGHPRLQSTLFTWLSGLWRFMLCLGLRVLRPP